MIDSSGRRALNANGTVLDLLPIGQTIAITGALLVALFTLVRPEASAGLDTLGRLSFWSLHVGLGLVCIWITSRWLANGHHLPQSTLLRVLLTGVAGALIAAPGYLALDYLFAPYQLEQIPDNTTDRLIGILLKEIAEITPWFMASWLLINLPVLLPRPTLNTSLDDAVSHTPLESEIESVKKRDTSEVPSSTAASDIAQQFLSSLPGIIGKDVLAVSSDLHYLNVWTLAGRTTVLGNLKDVVSELDNIGMQVHRSHWIAYSHVRRIVGTANSGACILSNELRIPISRRRWKEVREQFGRGVVSTSTNDE